MRPLLVAIAGLAALAVAGPGALGRLALHAGLDRPAAWLLSDPAARGVALKRAAWPCTRSPRWAPRQLDEVTRSWEEASDWSRPRKRVRKPSIVEL